VQKIEKERDMLPSRLFCHGDLLSSLPASPLVKQKDLLNTLHRIHFTDGQVLIHVSDPKHSEDLLIRGRLEACAADQIRCLWPADTQPVSDLTQLRHLILEDGFSLLIFPLRITQHDHAGFSFAIPDEGRLVGKRRIRRNACRDIVAEIAQNGFLTSGELLDFTPLAFRILVPPPPNASFIWMNTDHAFTVSLRKENRVLFHGPCHCLRHSGTARGRELVMVPQESEISRFRKKKNRMPRLSITPTPAAHFAHPLFGKNFRRDILNLTFAGFVVEERGEDGVLMPGLIIENLEIRYAEALTITCDAQVIYRREVKSGRVRCGMAILDMDFRAYRTLSHIMVNAGDPQAQFSSDLDTDALWEFLFSTGFIYPQKYHAVQSWRNEFKETYRRLCRNDQEIEAHFTYQENGKIYGHVSIFRAYQRAWMVHHLAARPLDGKRTGLPVIRNILRFFDGLYRYPSIRMDHMLFYFRPENHFPNLFFGGFARSIANQRACSLDLFAYLGHSTRKPQTAPPEGWQLKDFGPGHLPELERYYRRASGGLLLDVLRLGQPDDPSGNLEEVFQRYGFQRQWRAYSLLSGEALKAVFIVNHSSPGLNLSELLNSITVIVTDPEGLPGEALNASLGPLASQFQMESVPLLIYPADYPATRAIHADKQYLLWILDTQYGREYLDYMEKKTKFTLRFLFKYLLRKVMR
jgi:hypothetical protein